MDLTKDWVQRRADVNGMLLIQVPWKIKLLDQRNFYQISKRQSASWNKSVILLYNWKVRCLSGTG